jgi:muramoyltetrapeptide carboxypeptidase
MRPGDVVAVVAPAGPVPPDRLREGLSLLGVRYRLRVDPTVWQRHGYLAAPDAARAEALQRAFDDPDVRGILCARGGYGVTRLLSSLDPAPLVADPKPIVGFSDITALHAWALAAGLGSIHGPVVTQLGSLPGSDIAHLLALLEGPHLEGCLAGRLLLPGSPAVDAPVAAGPLVGGNLSLLAALAGTPWAVPYAGALVLLEEVAEAPYRLDRMITQLRQQRALPVACDAAACDAPGHPNRTGPSDFDRAAGFGIGDLFGCRADGPAPAGTGPSSASPSLGPSPGQPTALAVLLERLAPIGRSVVGSLPFGHGSRNLAWPVGAPATLDPATGEVCWTGA